MTKICWLKHNDKDTYLNWKADEISSIKINESRPPINGNFKYGFQLDSYFLIAHDSRVVDLYKNSSDKASTQYELIERIDDGINNTPRILINKPFKDVKAYYWGRQKKPLNIPENKNDPQNIHNEIDTTERSTFKSIVNQENNVFSIDESSNIIRANNQTIIEKQFAQSGKYNAINAWKNHLIVGTTEGEVYLFEKSYSKNNYDIVGIFQVDYQIDYIAYNEKVIVAGNNEGIISQWIKKEGKYNFGLIPDRRSNINVESKVIDAFCFTDTLLLVRETDNIIISLKTWDLEKIGELTKRDLKNNPNIERDEPFKQDTLLKLSDAIYKPFPPAPLQKLLDEYPSAVNLESNSFIEVKDKEDLFHSLMYMEGNNMPFLIELHKVKERKKSIKVHNKNFITDLKNYAKEHYTLKTITIQNKEYLIFIWKEDSSIAAYFPLENELPVTISIGLIYNQNWINQLVKNSNELLKIEHLLRNMLADQKLLPLFYANITHQYYIDTKIGDKEKLDHKLSKFIEFINKTLQKKYR